MAKPSGYVEALWVANFEAELPNKTILIPRETVALIPEGEAIASDHWEPVAEKKKEKSD